MTKNIFLLILLSVAMSSLAQIALKSGLAPAAPGTPAPSGIADTLWAMVLNPMVIVGLAVYFASALVWLFVLKRVDVSIAYPCVGIGFILTMLLAWLLRGEPITLPKLGGTLLIALGVAVLARA